MVHQPLHVLADQVDTQRLSGARVGLAEIGARQGLGDQRDLDPIVAKRRDGEADALQRYRTLGDDVARERGGELHPQALGKAIRLDREHRRGAVDMALDDVAAEAIVGAQSPTRG